jgi:pimeloyl-ACP methyl ester carboxylesterase
LLIQLRLKFSVYEESILEGLAGPEMWPEMALKLRELNQTLNGESKSGSCDGATSDLRAYSTSYAFQAVTCGDAADAPNSTTTEAVFKELRRVTQSISLFLGPMWGDAGLYCHRWTSRAKEPFQGPWNSKPKHPVLIIGSTADPRTPFKSAEWLAENLGTNNTFLIEEKGAGHCPKRKTDGCVSLLIKEYFSEKGIVDQPRSIECNPAISNPWIKTT